MGLHGTPHRLSAGACRHDTPELANCVLRETRQCEGTFAELRAAGAPGEGPAYAGGDVAAQTMQVRGWQGCCRAMQGRVKKCKG